MPFIDGEVRSGNKANFTLFIIENSDCLFQIAAVTVLLCKIEKIDRFYEHCSSACFTSAIISSIYSIPTDILIRFGVTPQSISCWSLS